MKQVKHHLIRVLILIIAVISTPFFLQAQSMQVKGKISDAATNKSLEGVSVAVQNSKVFAITNADGEFSLDAAQDAKLNVTATGFDAVVVSAGNGFLSIMLTPSVKQMEEIVVTALGIKKDKKK